MSRYDLDEVVQRWAREELTAEQAIGQILLHLEDLRKRMEQLEKEALKEER
ncbi:MAG: hypothetical protein AAF702_12225 [Chloroflexota bacterium]